MMRRTVRTTQLTIPVVLIISGFVLLWSYLFTMFFPPVTFGPQLGVVRPAEMHAGDSVWLCRDLEIHRTVELTLTRLLVSPQPDGSMLKREFGNSALIQEPAKYTPQCRIIEIPEDLPPGVWTMQTWLSYTSWPFWRMMEEAPPVKFRIIPADEI